MTLRFGDREIRRRLLRPSRLESLIGLRFLFDWGRGDRLLFPGLRRRMGDKRRGEGDRRRLDGDVRFRAGDGDRRLRIGERLRDLSRLRDGGLRFRTGVRLLFVTVAMLVDG